LIFLTERILYPYYMAVPRLWGFTVLEDQSQGWTIMAMAGGTAYLTAILLLVARLAEYEERMVRAQQTAGVPGGEGPG
ncbi:MAG: hypothetical protein ACE5JU_22660, partial [Candidatus Binatia bacterium]